jgi:hypothetical protein
VDNLGLKGKYRVIRKNGEVAEFENNLTDYFYGQLVELLKGNTGDIHPTRCQLGAIAGAAIESSAYANNQFIAIFNLKNPTSTPAEADTIWLENSQSEKLTQAPIYVELGADEEITVEWVLTFTTKQ